MDFLFPVVGACLIGLGIACVGWPESINRFHRRVLWHMSDEEEAGEHAIIYTPTTNLWITRVSGIGAIVIGLAFIAGLFLGNR